MFYITVDYDYGKARFRIDQYFRWLLFKYRFVGKKIAEYLLALPDEKATLAEAHLMAKELLTSHEYPMKDMPSTTINGYLMNPFLDKVLYGKDHF